MLAREILPFLAIENPSAKKVLILGLPGSGKSALAQALAEHKGLRHIEVDRFYWKDSKGGEVNEAYREDLKQAMAGGPWVIEGHFSKIRSLFSEPFDLVLVLDVPLHTLLLRLLKRDLVRFFRGLQISSDLVFVLKNWNTLREQLKTFRWSQLTRRWQHLFEEELR